MRAVEDILVDYRAAMGMSDYEAVATFADELAAVGSPIALAEEQNARGNIASYTGEPAHAVECFHRSISLHENLGNKLGVAIALGNLGGVHLNIGEYSQALEYTFRSLGMSEELGDTYGIAHSTGNLGLIYSQTGEHDRAIEQYQRALDLQKTVQDKAAIARAYGNLGQEYHLAGDFEKSLEYTTRAVELMTEIGDSRSIAIGIAQLVMINIKKGDLDSAEVFGESIGDEVFADPYVNFISKQAKAQLLTSRGDLQGAVKTLESALEIVRKAHMPSEEAEVHKELRDIALLENNLASYVAHNDAHLKIVADLTGHDATRRLAMQEKEREFEAERREAEKHKAALYATLPKHVADRVVKGEQVTDQFESATVLFLDIVKFTQLSSTVPPGHVVHLLEAVFGVCDDVCNEHGLVKVKTIGDSYLAVSGVPAPLDNHVERAAKAALEIMAALEKLQVRMDPEQGDTSWTKNVGDVQVRIGLHCGPVVAGIVGKDRLQYDIWGDTVNVASRMESTGEPSKIQVSEAFAETLSALSSQFSVFDRGETSVKGKGLMKTFWLEENI